MGRCYFGLRQFSEARVKYLEALDMVSPSQTSAYNRLQSQVIECEVSLGTPENIRTAFELLDDLKSRMVQQDAPSSLSPIDEPRRRTAETELEYVECIDRKIALIWAQRDQKMGVLEKLPSEAATFGNLTGFAMR